MAYRNRNDLLEHTRKGLGLTQTQLSEQSGVRQSTISMLEAGHLPAAIVSVLRLAQALGRPVEDLFGHMLPPPTSRTRKPARARPAASRPGPVKTRTKRAPKALAAVG